MIVQRNISLFIYSMINGSVGEVGVVVDVCFGCVVWGSHILNIKIN